MKFVIFGVLAVCLVLTNAAVIDPLDYSVRIMEHFKVSLVQKADEVSLEVQAKYDELITQPVERVDESINAIETRREESAECVEHQKEDLEIVVQNLENSFDDCSQVAATSSKNIAMGIVEITTDLVYDTIKLAKGVQKCKSYENSSLKSACYAAETNRAMLLVKKSENAVGEITQSVDQTLPQVLEDFEQCSVNAEQYANAQLENINLAIDGCVAALL